MTMLSPLPEPGPQRARLVDARLELASRARADGDHERAVATVVESIRAGLWRHAPLWSELLSMMERPSGYAQMRALWLDSPRQCHNSRSIMLIVAQAAAAAAEHDEAQALLRKAILREGRRRRKLRSRLRRFGRSVTAPAALSDFLASASLDAPDVEQTDPELFYTFLHFALLRALIESDRKMSRRCIRQLGERGSDTWLSRL